MISVQILFCHIFCEVAVELYNDAYKQTLEVCWLHKASNLKQILLKLDEVAKCIFTQGYELQRAALQILH